jgi:Putative transposase DNA-binding domain
MTARVAKYGCLAPIEGREHVEEQVRLAARYYNELIALERTRRVVYRDLRDQYVPGLEANTSRVRALADELDALRTEVKTARKEARGRVQTADLDKRAKTLREELKAARETLKAARAQANEDPGLQEAGAALEERAKIWHKALRAERSPFWGTYLLVEASVEQARKALVDPTFRRARGRERVSETGIGMAEGRVGVQIQGGMSVAELLSGEDNRLRLVDAPPELAGKRGTSARAMRRGARKLLYIRVGSKGREPIWAVFPVIYHRDIPEYGRVKSVTVSLRVSARREQWTVQFTYTHEPIPMPPRAGILALDLGWRNRPDEGLRVAYWCDDRGEHGQVTVAPRIRERVRRGRDLQEIQDLRFNRATSALQRWLSVRVLVPDWLDKERQHLGQWRSHERLRRLVFHWRDHRFAGDRTIFNILEMWLHRSRHLSQYQDGCREGALNNRREEYRKVAAKIARNYGTVILERFNLAKAKRLPAPEEGDRAPQAMRSQAFDAAPGELRSAIVQAVQREGGLIVELSATNTTSTCHACGCVCKWDHAADVWHRCEHCGVAWDQDENAARNLLTRFAREQSGAEESTALTREARKGPKWVKKSVAGTGEDP